MKHDRKIAIFLMAISVLIFIKSYGFPKAELQRGPGPGAFPMFLALILIVLSIMLFIMAGRIKKKAGPIEASRIESDTEAIDESIHSRIKRIVKAIGLLAIYFVILPYLGFVIASIIFGMAYLIFLYGYKLLKSIIPACSIALAGHLLFRVALKIPLPTFMEAIK